jgi:predicted metal-dependent enzyme (double-stranded beta helix superfamily)
MTGENWLVTNDGQCNTDLIVNQAEELTNPYRLYRFLTDLEDILDRIRDDRLRLQAICPLVRRLLTSSDWLQITPLDPNPETGWDVLMLYDEPFFPLTVQLVAWAPGMTSPIHNHGCWGLVALLSGQEKNTFWRLNRPLQKLSPRPGRMSTPQELLQMSNDQPSGAREPKPEFSAQIEPVSNLLLTPGDIICFMPEAIHHVEAISDEPTISFNLYGETNYDQRFEFDSLQKTAKRF